MVTSRKEGEQKTLWNLEGYFEENGEINIWDEPIGLGQQLNFENLRPRPNNYKINFEIDFLIYQLYVISCVIQNNQSKAKSQFDLCLAQIYRKNRVTQLLAKFFWNFLVEPPLQAP